MAFPEQVALDWLWEVRVCLPAKRMRVTYPGGRKKLKGENRGEGVEGAFWELEKRLGRWQDPKPWEP